MKFLWLEAIFVLLLSAFAPEITNASCCSSAASGGVPRLLPHERAMVELATSIRKQYGHFNQNAQFNFGHSHSLPYLFVEQEAQISTRLLDFFEPFIRLPVRIQKSDQRSCASFSDFSFGARFPMVNNASFGGLSFTAQARVPSGTAFDMEKRIDKECITTNGLWLYTMGVVLDKTLASLNFSFAYSLALESDYFRDSKSSLGPSHAISLTLGYPLDENNTVTFSIAPLFQGARRKLTAQASYLLTLHSHIQWITHLGADLPVSHLGRNYQGEWFVKTGLRFGVF